MNKYLITAHIYLILVIAVLTYFYGKLYVLNKTKEKFYTETVKTIGAICANGITEFEATDNYIYTKCKGSNEN